MNNSVYICSPCRGDYDKNIKNAVTYCRQVFRLGYLPVAPHIYFPHFMDDTVPNERERAMKAGSELMLRCAEVWVFGLDKPSERMMEEIALAIRNNIPVKDGFVEVVKNTNVIRMRDDLTESELKSLLEKVDRAPIMTIPKQGDWP